jgi:plastocyanin
MRSIALILAPLLVVMLLMAACSGDDDDDGGAATAVDSSPTPLATVQNQPEPVQPVSGEPSQPEEGVYEIVSENSVFQGNDVQLPLGQPSIIRVVNRDQLTHNLRIAGLDGQYDTEDDAVTEPAAVEPGSSGELSFAPAIPGAYTFRCDYHPGSMGGQITVQ